MIFEKPSLRTHVSFDTGMAQLGGHAVYLGPQNIGALDGSRESVKDISSVLTRMCDVVTARVFERDVCFPTTIMLCFARRVCSQDHLRCVMEMQ